MEYKKEKNQNSSNKININNSQKEEDTSIMSLLWEGIVNIFKSEDNKDQKISQNNNKIKYQYCNCKITHSKEYCDNVYCLMQMLKNDIDPKKSKILYENLLKVH